MKKLLITFMLVLLSHSSVTLAGTLSSEQNAIKSLIQKMYAIDPDTFEYAEFGGKYKNGLMVSEGKHDPKRQCLLLEEFLVKEAVIKNEKAQSCKTSNDGYFRYPGVSEMELSSATRDEPLPKTIIKSPVVSGDKAKIQVIFPRVGANVMYYLRKQPEGWRIYRVESSHNSATIETKDEREGDSIDIFPPAPEQN